MQGTHEQFDADRSADPRNYAVYPTDSFQHDLNCSICNRTFYVDRVVYDSAVRSIEEGLDNPFLCDECESEYEEFAHKR